MKNNKVIVLGSSGFIAKNLKKFFLKKKVNSTFISSKTIDLVKQNSYKKLSKKINTGNIVIFISAKAPVKNLEMLTDNIKILENVSKAIGKKKIKQIIYISSDAVYSDSIKKIRENYNREPDNLHGMMHVVRENYLKSMFLKKLCILRPTLIYGEGDPHNGYGPNKFMRLAKKNEDILLFGKGEELRDHININDVVKIIYYSVIKNFRGEYTLATGNVISFFNIAKIIKKLYNSKSEIIFQKRLGKMPHRGYRCFDVNKIKKKIKNLKFIKINDKKYLNV
jgi:nucleoside-diphosphate-sugar epimerase